MSDTTDRIAEIRREWDAGRDICRHTEWLLAYAEGEAHRDRVIAQQTHYLLAAEARVAPTATAPASASATASAPATAPATATATAEVERD